MDGGDIVNGGGAIKRCWGNFGKPKTANLACFDHRRQRFSYLFNRCVTIAAVNIVKIDIIQPQPRKRGVKLGLKVGRTIVEIAASCFLINSDSSLGGNVKKFGLLPALLG